MSGPDQERRSNQTLRELLDELVEHVRYVARNARTMSPEDMEYAERRLEWLAEEVWSATAARSEP